jgi:phosphoketolase
MAEPISSDLKTRMHAFGVAFDNPDLVVAIREHGEDLPEVRNWRWPVEPAAGA